MNRFFRTTFAILACLQLCGGHWGMLQVVAWSRMMVEYSTADGVIAGAKKTFNGEHPCEMCKAITKGKTEESKGEKPVAPGHAQVDVLAKGFVPMEDCRVADPGWTELLEIPAAFFVQPQVGRAECPPVPPPRWA